MAMIEMRCPKRQFRLFGKVSEERPEIVPGNLIEFACRECARDQGVKRVLHRYNIVGELVETEVIRA